MQNPQPTKLPTKGNLAIYVRTAATQEAVRSCHLPHMTADDLTTFAHEMGWTADHITVYEEHGISGSAAFDKRPSFTALFDAIRQGSVNSILVSDEYRLFREATAVAITMFIRLCQEQSVRVITPQTTYDFSNPTHVQLFRFLLESDSFAIYARTSIGKRYKKRRED